MDDKGNKIFFHADDFGVTVEQSRRILACHRDGVLNSISILPNTSALGESLKLLDEIDADADKIRRVLHLNFVEGAPLAGAENVPLLVDKTGLFNKSFIKFFQWNYTKQGAARRKLTKQIKLEIAAQLRAVTIDNDYRITAVDSHQHYHMIPLIFDCLMDVLSEPAFQHLPIRYVRIPADPTLPISQHAKLRKGVPRINWVKWGILKLYANRNRTILRRKGIRVPVFFGIFYTCEMRTEVVEGLLPAYKAYADSRREDLELMFHPGNLAAEYELLDKRNKALAEFYMSDNRYYEAECLKTLKHNCYR